MNNSIFHQYYRIRAIDADSATKVLSKTIHVFFGTDKPYAIMNAYDAARNINLRLSLDEKTKIDILIYNLTGQAVKRFQKEVQKGISIIDIPVIDLQPGIYIMSLLPQHKPVVNFRFIRRP